MTARDAIANLKMIRVAFVEPITVEQVKLIDDTFNMAIKALERVPKNGHWWLDTDSWLDIFPAVNGYRCSECNNLNIDESRYCSNCGAKMESEGDNERSD